MNIFFDFKERWAHYFRPEKQMEEAKVTISNIEKRFGKLKLADVFEKEKRYQFIMDVLVHRKMISPVTHYWTDHGKGYKKTIVGILKKLHSQGYYKDHQELTHQQIIEVSYNTFGVIIGIDTIKHTNYQNVFISYIPPASTV